MGDGADDGGVATGANPCSGAIVLQLRDVRAGAGWGLIDVFGHPKAAFYGMGRAARR